MCDMCIHVDMLLSSCSGSSFVRMARMRSNITDEELKDLLKVSMGPENPVKHVTYYRSSTSDELCNRHQTLFVGVATKNSRLNKTQLFKCMYTLYKGAHDDVREISTRLANVFSTLIRQRKHVSTGARLHPASLNIIGAFSAHVDSSESSSISLEPISPATSPSPSISPSPQGSPRGASSSIGGQAEELLRKAQERFPQRTKSPPRKMKTIQSLDADSPVSVPDSPVQANTIFYKK